MFEVVWTQLTPHKREITRRNFTDLEDARREAELVLLSIPGTAEAKILDGDHNQLDLWVRNND